MKRFWFIIAATGLMIAVTAKAQTCPECETTKSKDAAAFYKVQCYDANDKLVSCDSIAKIKKHAAVKKSNKTKIAKAKKAADALAQKKAREKAIAIRELAKQNEELKTEMQALRRANLLAAAKTEEKPADTAQLAATTTVQVPAAPISTTQVAKEPETGNKSPWSFNAMNWVRKSMQQDTPLTNELDLTVAYDVNPDYTLALEEDLNWNWSNPKNEAKQGFSLSDIQPIINFNNIYASQSKQTKLFGDITGFVGVSEESRDNGMIFSARFRLRLQTAVNEQKGWFRFDTFVIPAIYKYTTTTSKTGDTFETASGNIDGLTPNSRLDTGVKVWFHHKIAGSLSFETTVKFRGKYTYADEVDTGTEILTLTEAQWRSDIEIELPRIIYTVSDNLTFDGALSSTGSLSKFKPFSIDDGNNLKFVFRMIYDI
jgi:hypothetical protein